MNRTVTITKSLSEANRLRIIIALTEQKELCVCQITELLGLATATVSRHLSVLQNASLINNRKDGRWVYYRLTDTFPTLLLTWLKQEMEISPIIESDRKKLENIISCDLYDLRCNKR